MSAKSPSDTASDTPLPGSSSGSDCGLPSSIPLFKALVFSAEGWVGVEFFQFEKDKTIVQSNSYSIPRPDSRLHQRDGTTCGKFSVIHMSKHHLLYMAPGEEEGLLPNPFTTGLTSGDMYLLKVKEPHGLLAYEDISVPPPADRDQFWDEIYAEMETAMKARLRFLDHIQRS